MGSKKRLSIYCTKRHENPANFVTSRIINMRLAIPIRTKSVYSKHSDKTLFVRIHEYRYIVIVFTSIGMVMFSQNLLNTIGTQKRSDRPKQEITCEC